MTAHQILVPLPGSDSSLFIYLFILLLVNLILFLKLKKKKKSLVFDSYGFGRIQIAVELGLDSIVF